MLAHSLFALVAQILRKLLVPLVSSGSGGLGESFGVGTAYAAPADTAPLFTMDGHMGDWDDWAWGWLFMMPMMLIFWGGLIWLIVWLVRRTGGDTGSRDNEPIEIARRRYARGEITSDELEQIRRHLSG